MPPLPPPSFKIPPPPTTLATLSFPAPHVLLVTLNRPKQLNCINSAGNLELDRVWAWLDEEVELRVGIITGAGRAFCAGADLKGVYLCFLAALIGFEKREGIKFADCELRRLP